MHDALKAFTCRMCGQCCQGSGGIVAVLSEQKKIAEYLDLDLVTFMDRFIRRKGAKSFVRVSESGWCIFFTRDQGCLVHPVKPRACRAWPFFRGNLMDEISFEMAREYCPGIEENIAFDQFVRQGMDYLQKYGLSLDLEEESAAALHVEDIRSLMTS